MDYRHCEKCSIRWLELCLPLDVRHSTTIVLLFNMPHAKWLPRQLTTIREEPSPSTPYLRLENFDEGCPEIEAWLNYAYARSQHEDEDEDEVDPADLALTPDHWTKREVEDELDYEDEIDYEPLLDQEMGGGSSSSDGLPLSPSDGSSDVGVVIDRNNCNLAETVQHLSPIVHHKEPLESLSLVATALDHVGQVTPDRSRRVPKRRMSDSSFDEGKLNGHHSSIERTDSMRAVDRNKLPRLDTGPTTFYHDNITPIGASTTFMEILAERSDGDGTWYKVQWRETWVHEGNMPAITPIRQDHHLRHGRLWQVVPPKPRMT